MFTTLYQEILLDHYRNPRNRTILEKPSFVCADQNPSCGDSISFTGHISIQDTIEKLAFQGSGCVISQAIASLLTDELIAKPVDELLQLDAVFLQSLIGMSLGPTRLRCALLPLNAIQKGVQGFIEQQGVKKRA